MPDQYSVKQAKELLLISTGTLRRIADQFDDHLPDYKSRPGTTRTFTDGDLRTIYAIFSRLQSSPGLTRSVLLLELSEPGSEPLIIPATLPTDRLPDRLQADQDASERAIATPPDHPTIDRPQDDIRPLVDVHQLDTLITQLIARRMSELSRKDVRPSAQEWRISIAATIALIILFSGIFFAFISDNGLAVSITSVLAIFILASALIWPSIRKR